MNIEEMQIAAKARGETCILDEELLLDIKAHEMIIEYFRERGEYFGLITTCMVGELESLCGVARARRLVLKVGDQDELERF